MSINENIEIEEIYTDEYLEFIKAVNEMNNENNQNK